jgi:nicotinamidase-related amidase
MLELDNTTLVIIDIQGNLYEAMHDKEFLYESLSKMISVAKLLGIPILVTEQIPEKLGSTIPRLADQLAGNTFISKSYFSSCKDDGFVKALKGINKGQILMTGIETHVCVYQTSLDLMDMGYEVNVIADCVSSRTALNRDIGLERLVTSGAKLSSVEMASFELLKLGDGEKFRQMIKIVK